MRTFEIKENNRFVLIGTIMVAVSVFFLLYMGASLYYSSKQFQAQSQVVELVYK